MLRMLRRSCTMSCVGCLLPPLVVLAVIAYGIHLMTTPPPYPPVSPAPASSVELTALRGIEHALATQAPVALVQLDDQQATALLNQTLAGYAGLGDLQVHILQGEVVVTGQTAILSHPLVISGPVTLSSGGGAIVDLHFQGLWIGQLGLPRLVPQLLSRGLHPAFNLDLIAPGRRLRFACSSAAPGSLTLGLLYTPQADPHASAACLPAA
ncbi:MAG: hypothetical protein ACYCYK_03325 [Candidatus Dormibacteria bacterium]